MRKPIWAIIYNFGDGTGVRYFSYKKDKNKAIKEAGLWYMVTIQKPFTERIIEKIEYYGK